MVRKPPTKKKSAILWYLSFFFLFFGQGRGIFVGQRGYAPATRSCAPGVHPYERQRLEPVVLGLRCSGTSLYMCIFCTFYVINQWIDNIYVVPTPTQTCRFFYFYFFRYINQTCSYGSLTTTSSSCSFIFLGQTSSVCCYRKSWLSLGWAQDMFVSFFMFILVFVVTEIH